MMYSRCRAAPSVLLAAQPFKNRVLDKARNINVLLEETTTRRRPAAKSADLEVILTGAEPGEASGSDTLRSDGRSNLAASHRAGR